MAPECNMFSYKIFSHKFVSILLMVRSVEYFYISIFKTDKINRVRRYRDINVCNYN